MTSRVTIGRAVQVVTFLLTGLGGFLKSIAPPDETGTPFALGVASSASLVALFFASGLLRGRDSRKSKKYWFPAAALLLVLFLISAFVYQDARSKSTFLWPPNAEPKKLYVAGDTLTPQAQQAKNNDPSLTTIRLIAGFGGIDERTSVWTEGSIHRAGQSLKFQYLLTLLSMAAAIFSLIEGLLRGTGQPSHAQREYATQGALSSDKRESPVTGKASPRPASERQSGLTVFISYAHKDNESPDPSKRWLDRLLEQIQPLVLQNQVSTWSDTEIETGDHWHESIQAQLRNAKVAVLLISPAFLASKYIRNSELPTLLMKAKQEGVTILPIILRHCLYAETRFKYPDPLIGPEELSLSTFQSANPPNKPLNAMGEHEQDQLLVSVAQRVLKIAQLDR